jgi:hypothetical protein
MFGVERGCLAVMWPLASHPSNKNELIAWDLAHDPAELASLDVATLRQRLFTRSADLPEGVARLPVKTVHLNKSPVVIGNLKVLTPALQARWGLDLEQALRHAATARDLPDMSAIWPEVFRRPEPDAPVDPEHDLYGGFVGNADRRRLTQLRALDPAALARARTGFDDPRLAGAAAALARPQPPRHPEPRGSRAVAAAPRSPSCWPARAAPAPWRSCRSAWTPWLTTPWSAATSAPKPSWAPWPTGRSIWGRIWGERGPGRPGKASKRGIQGQNPISPPPSPATSPLAT